MSDKIGKIPKSTYFGACSIVSQNRLSQKHVSFEKNLQRKIFSLLNLLKVCPLQLFDKMLFYKKKLA
jgi:hypothetical protein